MDAQSLREGMRLKDADYPERVERLTFLARCRDGTQYDHIMNPFSEERDGSGAYIKLRDRRPSAKTGLCRVVVDDSVSLLFGEGRFPMVHSSDEETRTQIKKMITDTNLCEVMNAAAVQGSIGSVAVLMRVLGGRVFFEVMDTTFLTPSWRPDAPDQLAKVTLRYKVLGKDLRAAGYAVADGTYWFQRCWDADAETWYQPLNVTDAAVGKPHLVDDERTVNHALGFVPIVWIKNLPTLKPVDGDCTFEAAISTVMEMDYQLSQVGRGLKYASDPTLLIKEPALGEDGTIVRSASQAIIVSKDGDAKMLEINGTAASAVVDYVRVMRETALESVHGNRTNVDKLNGAQSGRALELMNQGLIWLADRLRITYGQNGLLSLIRMACKATGLPVADLSLVWPKYFPPTYDEKFQEAQAYTSLYKESLISQHTAIGKMAADNDVEDVDEEIARIMADQVQKDARLAAQAAAKEMVQVKTAES